MNVLLEELNQKRQIRAKQVLNELEQRGVEKVGKNKIESLMKQEEVDCDQIESFYQKELEKDRAAFEVQQRQKRNEVELLAHSTKCEEKKALLAYCDKHGEKAVAEIKAAIEEREKQASHTRQQLESATGSFERYHKA